MEHIELFNFEESSANIIKNFRSAGQKHKNISKRIFSNLQEDMKLIGFTYHRKFNKRGSKLPEETRLDGG